DNSIELDGVLALRAAEGRAGERDGGTDSTGSWINRRNLRARHDAGDFRDKSVGGAVGCGLKSAGGCWKIRCACCACKIYVVARIDSHAQNVVAVAGAAAEVGCVKQARSCRIYRCKKSVAHAWILVCGLHRVGCDRKIRR